MGIALCPASITPASWDAFSDVDAFVEEVLAELPAMAADVTRSTCPGPKPPLAGAALRKAIMAIWSVCFCCMQWRAIGQLAGLPFGTLYGLFARWTRLGLWRRLGQRLALDRRLARGDEVLPSAVVADSCSLRSAPGAWARGIDGGKPVKGIKVFVVCDKHGSLLDLELQPANTDDRAGTLPTLPRLATLGFQGDLLGDSGFKGAPFATAALVHDIHVSVSPGGTRDGRFLLPLGGVSAIDVPGMPFYDPAADAALFDIIRSGFVPAPNRKLVEVPAAINDRAFADAVLAAFREIA